MQSSGPAAAPASSPTASRQRRTRRGRDAISWRHYNPLVPISATRGRLPTFPVVLAGAAAFLDIYSTQPLLPLLTRTFGASTFEAGLTITAPTVAVAIFAPFIGRLADRLGFRRVIVLSAWALTVATALAATSHTLQQLIVWRFVQGIATPGIFASTVAYVHE